MESLDQEYKPGEDENQGVVSTMARTEEAGSQIGDSQVQRMSPNAMLPDPETQFEQQVAADDEDFDTEEDEDDSSLTVEDSGGESDA
ncbi:hypothetical protein [Tellurirhabdus bombi]|uniref:hypothetical protein n=1 Tax=Tellurirhabdus bombi TaxID=2907205 RepID=UPI001F3D1F5D|nr:hypothetical protein [Tellurirhabdus bombi]